MLDINTLKEVARGIMSYGNNRVAVKAVDIEIKKEHVWNGTKYIPYEFILPKEDGLLYYPLVPFLELTRSNSSGSSLYERFYFSSYVPSFGAVSLGDLSLSTVILKQLFGGSAVATTVETSSTSPRFVDSILFKYEPVTGTSGYLTGIGIGHYPILKFIVY